ncbi:TPA: hypothetical protein OTT33_003439 [Proteus mirabilis]|nr:hypothetical protein [Proteus mirabilis]
MGTILAVFAVIGAIFSLLSRDNRSSNNDALSDAAAGAASGFLGGIGCMFHLILMALPVLIGLWLISLIFG